MVDFEYLENDLKRPEQRLGDRRSRVESILNEGKWRGIVMLEPDVTPGSPPLVMIFLTANALLLTVFSERQSFS